MLTLYKNIKARRLDLKMSQDRLAELTGYRDRSSIAKIEKGDVDLAESKIREFAKALKTTPQELMGWDDIGTNIFTDDNISSPEDSMESPKAKKRASKNLNKILNAIGMSPVELSKDSGVSKSALNHYLKGDLVPSQENAEKMAAVLNVNPLWLMGIQKNMISDQPVVSDGAVQIKVLGRVAAGIPIEAVTEYIDTEEIPAKMAQSGDYFGLQIHGDSMEPRMREGDVVIVRKQDDAENGDIVIAMVNGSDATCKRLTKYAGGIGLISLNPNYDPMMFTDQEIVDKPVRIIGKVVELRAKF